MLERAQNLIGYQFQAPELLSEALTHASIAGHRLDSNERMEFLGDAILGLVVSDCLFRLFPDYLEGELTKIKSAVVSRKSCAQISRALDLQSMLSLGKGMSGRAEVPSSVAAAVFESIIAAIYLDGGIDPARQFILRHIQPVIDEIASSAHQHNFKSLLQQHAQRNLPASPSYVLLDEKGPDHSKCFEVCVEINGHRYSSAWAASKKEAEQKAALLALEELHVVQIEPDGQIRLVAEETSLPQNSSPQIDPK
ncbi:MAG: ribonuclease III [Phycisphaeraceae bacterium]|nr:ribonuclease III [Phycisphaeraceae bacterium]